MTQNKQAGESFSIFCQMIVSLQNWILYLCTCKNRNHSCCRWLWNTIKHVTVRFCLFCFFAHSSFCHVNMHMVHPWIVRIYSALPRTVMFMSHFLIVWCLCYGPHSKSDSEHLHLVLHVTNVATIRFKREWSTALVSLILNIHSTDTRIIFIICIVRTV